MSADSNFIKSLDYKMVKEYIISFGKNIPIYGCEDERIELPSALLYRSANYLASCNCGENRGSLVQRLRELARLIERVRKARLALGTTYDGPDYLDEIPLENRTVAAVVRGQQDDRARRRLWLAVDKLAGFLWSCHKHFWFMVSCVTVFEDGRADVSRHHSGCWVSGRATIRKALFDSLGNKDVFIHVALTPYQAVFSVTHCREHLKTTRCPLHIPAVPIQQWC